MPIMPELYINPATQCKMVGYLGDTNYTKGIPPREFLEKLCLVESWGNVCASPGHYDCTYCNRATSSSEHFAGDYQWPDMLTHYIKNHNYLPPTEFIAFVMKSKKGDFLSDQRPKIQLPEFDF